MLDGGDVRRRWRGGGEARGGVVKERLGRVENVEFEVFAALDEVCMIQRRGDMGGVG